MFVNLDDQFDMVRNYGSSQLILLLPPTSIARCPPCKAIKPIYEELSTKYTDVAFGKVDIDENSDAAVEFEIHAVPTFIFFDGEEPIETFSGADPTKLESFVKDLQAR